MLSSEAMLERFGSVRLGLLATEVEVEPLDVGVPMLENSSPPFSISPLYPGWVACGLDDRASSAVLDLAREMAETHFGILQHA